MKAKYLLIIIMGLLTIGTAVAGLVGGGRTYPDTLPDGTPLSSLAPLGKYDITDLLASTPIGQENTLYYKILVPNDNDDQWNLSMEFAESKPFITILPYPNNITIDTNNKQVYAWVCCNVTKSDRLYTADATTDSTLRGTLTNMYNLNYKSREPENASDINTNWNNVYVKGSKVSKVYNRRAARSQDGTEIGYAMQTKNVSIDGVPELMKVQLN